MMTKLTSIFLLVLFTTLTILCILPYTVTSTSYNQLHQQPTTISQSSKIDEHQQDIDHYNPLPLFPLQTTPTTPTEPPPPNVRVTLESSRISGSGAVLRFVFLTVPTYSKLTIGYEQAIGQGETDDGCQLFDYVPLNSFFSPNWDNTKIHNCFYFSSFTYMGRVIVNSDTCNSNNVFSFEFAETDLTTIQSTIKPNDMFECYLILATEPSYPDIPTPTPYIQEMKVTYVDGNQISPQQTTTPPPQSYSLQSNQNLTIVDPPDVKFIFNLPVFPIEKQNALTAIEFRDFFAHYQQRISILEVWFLELPPNSSIPIGLYEDEDLDHNLLEDQDMLMLQERMRSEFSFNYQCIRNIARLHIPLESTYTVTPPIAPGLGAGSTYPTTTTFLNSDGETEQTFMCQFLFLGQPHTQNYTFFFGDQIKTNLTRPALDLRNKVTSITEQYNGITPSPLETIPQLCFANMECTEIPNSTCNLSTHLCQPPQECKTTTDCTNANTYCNTSTQLCTASPCVTDSDCPLAPYSVCDVGTGLCQERSCVDDNDCTISAPFTICDTSTWVCQQPSCTADTDCTVEPYNTCNLTTALCEKPVVDPTSLMDKYYSFTYQVAIQLPISIFTNQTFILDLHSVSQNQVVENKMILTTKAITKDIITMMTNETNVLTNPPNSLGYPPNLDHDVDQLPIEPGQITLQYITELPSDWNEYYGSWLKQIYQPSPTEYQYFPPPPTPPNVANITSIFEISVYEPILINGKPPTGFDLFYNMHLTLPRQNSRTGRRQLIRYNPNNPIHLPGRPIIDPATPPLFSTTDDSTNNNQWVWNIEFKMDPKSYPSSAEKFFYPSPQHSNDDDDDDDQEEASLEDFERHDDSGYIPKYGSSMPPDGFTINGFYTSPIALTDSMPKCKYLIQTQTGLVPEPTIKRPVGTIENDGLDFEAYYTSSAGKYWRVGFPFWTPYQSTDVFFIQCTQLLDSGLKTPIRDNSVVFTAELVTHPRRWFQKTKTRKFNGKVNYPIHLLPTQHVISPTTSRVAFQMSGPVTIQSALVYENYIQSALFMLKNQLLVESVNPGIALAGITVPNNRYPFWEIKASDINLVQSQRQEWTRSLNHIGKASLNYATYSPFESFSIYTPNNPDTVSLIFGISDQYFLNYGIDLDLFLNFISTNPPPNSSASDPDLFDAVFEFQVEPNLPQGSPPALGPESLRFDFLQVALPTPIPPPPPPAPQPQPQLQYYWFPKSVCFDPGYNITGVSSLNPAVCPAAIGQQVVDTITQCPFDYYSTMAKVNPQDPLVAVLTTPKQIEMDYQSILDGFNTKECGWNQYTLDEFKQMEKFWGRYQNNSNHFNSYYILLFTLIHLILIGIITTVG